MNPEPPDYKSGALTTRPNVQNNVKHWVPAFNYDNYYTMEFYLQAKSSIISKYSFNSYDDEATRFYPKTSLKEIENMDFVFLSTYTNTRESLGELEKAVETLACGSCSLSISRSPKLPLVFV